MSSSVPVPLPAPARGPRLLWTATTNGRPRGLMLAREKGLFLIWDDAHWLTLLNRRGERQAQLRTPGRVSVGCCADDGSAYAAAGTHGEVWWLAPDLMTRWERSVGHPVVAVALDPFGGYLAVADVKSRLHLFDRAGRTVCQAETTRSLHLIAFVPEAPLLIGAADFGLVAGFDLKGRCVWRDGLVVHIGSLSVNGNGEQIVLACYTDGLRCYSLKGEKLGRLSLAEPCHLVSTSYDGRRLLAAGMTNQIHGLDARGRILWTHLLEKSVTAVALGPLGQHAAVALADGRILGLDLSALPAS